MGEEWSLHRGSLLGVCQHPCSCWHCPTSQGCCGVTWEKGSAWGCGANPIKSKQSDVSLPVLLGSGPATGKGTTLTLSSTRTEGTGEPGAVFYVSLRIFTAPGAAVPSESSSSVQQHITSVSCPGDVPLRALTPFVGWMCPGSTSSSPAQSQHEGGERSSTQTCPGAAPC